MKSGMPGVDWIFVFATPRCLQLEEGRHAVAAEAEEDPLPQAQDPGVAPAQHQAHRHEGIRQILADQIEPEDVEHHRQRDQDERCDQRDADQFERARIGASHRHAVVTF
jgi:hypothetical protein